LSDLLNRVITGLVAVGLLAGCASSSSGGWTKAGASEAEVNRDTSDCMVQAQTLAPGPQGPRTVVQQDRYRRCMTDRGYVEAPAK
jgi:hypothetical protein